MGNIEEYSSDDENYEDDLSLTSTYLGFVDVAITAEEQPEFEDTFIGSSPIWVHPQSHPPKEFITCDNCKEPMGLLFQSYANLENSLYDRVIYVFSCANPNCFRKEGCVKAIRGVCKDPAKIKKLEDEIKENEKKELEEKMKLDEQKKLDIKMTSDLFNDLKKKDDGEKSGSNPFSAGSNPFAASSNPFASNSNPFASSSNPFAPATPVEEKEEDKEDKTEKKPTFAEKAAEAAKDDKQNPSKPLSATPDNLPELPEYPGFIVYMDQESLDKSKAPKLPKLPPGVEEVDEPVPSSSSNSNSGSQVSPEVEEMTKLLEDPTFQNFSNIVNYNPLQVLRYEINGKPLLYTIRDKVAKFFTKAGSKSTTTNGSEKLPKLSINPSPYATRRFEFQLMPKMIIDLESNFTNDEMFKKGMEWGTIIVATDSQDYVPELDENHCAYVQEWCGVQWEEEVKK